MSGTSSSPNVRMSTIHRVLIYSTCYNVIDGVTLTIRKIEQAILAAGHHVCILTTQSGSMDNTNLDGEHPHRRVIFLDNAVSIPFIQDPNNPELSYQIGFSLSKSVKEQIAEFEPSIIHVTTPDCTCLHLIQYARVKEIPLMGTYHSNIPEYMEHYPGVSWLKHILGAFFRHQYNFVQSLYVPTPYIRRYLADTYKMDKATNVGIWGRGIDLEKFSPVHRSLKLRQKLGVRDHEAILCWVGRLVPEKRPDIFASVVRRLYRQGVPFHALVIGAGPSEEEMKALPNTTFAGWLNGDELSVAYASSDIFLFPSAVETFGNVTLEAAASGLPLVVESGCSGHLVDHGFNGFACEAGNEDAFYEGTLALIVDRQSRHEFSEASRRFSMSFEKSAVMRQMLDNYDHITEEFYCEYGGRHSNRDALYRKENAFFGGNFPRPLVLVFVEYLFLVLFKVMWHLGTAFLHIRDSMMPNIPMPEPTASPAANIKPEPRSIPTIPSSPRLVDMGVVGLEVIAESDGEETASLATEDVSVDHKTDAKSPSAAGLQSAPAQELRLSHSLAIAFVNAMMLQIRMESAIRNYVSSCFSRDTWDAAQRKRKDSSIAVPVIRRPRSEGSGSMSDDSFDDSFTLMQEGSRMRRNLAALEC